MEALQSATADQPNVALLSISTDQDDTPEKLREYATGQHAGDRWFFVTGKKDEVFDLSVKGFKLALADANGVNLKEKFIHSTKIALIDKQGNIRGYYDGIGDNAAADKDRLLADIKRLLAE
jgi:protein SCO1/2